MSDPTCIPIGDSASAPFLAFGDESRAGDSDTLVYAYVIISRARISQVESRLRRLKKKFRIPEDLIIHCSKMMSPDQREKLGIGHLKTEDIRNFIGHAVTLMNECSVWLRYAYGSLAAMSRQLGSEITLESTSGSDSISLPVTHDYKGYLGLLANVCMAVPTDGSKGPPAHMCEIITAEEPSQVLFIGKRAQRADSLFQSFSEIGSPDGAVFQIAPSIAKANQLSCLQLADIAAYLCANALRKDQRYSFFPDQLQRVRYWANAEWRTQPL